jgi:hypothetical protein
MFLVYFGTSDIKGYKDNRRILVLVFPKFCCMLVTIHKVILTVCLFSYLVAVTIAGDRAANLGLCSAFRAFEQGGIFIVPHLL